MSMGNHKPGHHAGHGNPHHGGHHDKLLPKHNTERSTFEALLERLADEHEREITLLRTEVVELRTQLGVVDPVQRFVDSKTSTVTEVQERWDEERWVQDTHNAPRGGSIATAVQQWAEAKRQQAQAERENAEFTGAILSEKSPRYDGPSPEPSEPPSDWPPPAPIHRTENDVFWVSFKKLTMGEAEEDDDDVDNDKGGNNRNTSAATRSDTPGRQGRSEEAGEAAQGKPRDSDGFVRPRLRRMHEMVPTGQGSIMESQHAFREQEMQIKAAFQDASRVSNMKGIMASCFQVWALLTRHMRSHFSFQVLDPWRGEGPMPTAAGGLLQSHTMQMKGDAEEIDHGEVTEIEGEVPRRQGFGRLLLAPNATVRSWWDVIGTLLLCWDLMVIPMDAFEPDPNGFIFVMDYVTLVFWTLDIFMSCITGYVSKGVTVMDPKHILRNYLRTSFLMDMIVVGPDWIFLFITWGSEEFSGNDPAGGSNRLIRVMRVVRLVRLLRLVKVTRGLAMLRDRIESEVMFIVANILKLIVMLLIVNHFLGSLWYLVGNITKNEGQSNWIQEHHFEHVSFGYKYFTALHWSLTQFTPASMSVQPCNIYERVLAIFCLVFGLVLFSSFISSITASMTQLRNMSEDKSKQFWLLRRYLRQRGIDKKLAFRILRYVEYAIKEKTVLVSEAKVWSLSLLSHQLREELQYEVSFKCLMSHPFFERAREVSSMSTFQLAEQALSVESLASRDTLFNPGTLATHMFIVAYGQLKYINMDELFLDDIEEPQSRLVKDDWACEQALWTKWTHLGCLRAVSEVRLVAIDVKKFEDVVNKDPVAWDLAHTYCEKYVAWLNETPRGILTDVAHQDDMAWRVRSFLDVRVKNRTIRPSTALGRLTLMDQGDTAANTRKSSIMSAVMPRSCSR